MDTKEFNALVAAGKIAPAYGKSSKKRARPSLPDQEKGKRSGKFNARKTTVTGILFDSKLEANRYIFLKEQERKGNIKDLEMQQPYDIEINGMHVCKYVSDFCYTNNISGLFVVEDAKGNLTPIYKLKKKLMKAVLGIDIKEVTKDSITAL